MARICPWHPPRQPCMWWPRGATTCMRWGRSSHLAARRCRSTFIGHTGAKFTNPLALLAVNPFLVTLLLTGTAQSPQDHQAHHENPQKNLSLAFRHAPERTTPPCTVLQCAALHCTPRQGRAARRGAAVGVQLHQAAQPPLYGPPHPPPPSPAQMQRGQQPAAWSAKPPCLPAHTLARRHLDEWYGTAAPVPGRLPSSLLLMCYNLAFYAGDGAQGKGVTLQPQHSACGGGGGGGGGGLTWAAQQPQCCTLCRRCQDPRAATGLTAVSARSQACPGCCPPFHTCSPSPGRSWARQPLGWPCCPACQVPGSACGARRCGMR